MVVCSNGAGRFRLADQTPSMQHSHRDLIEVDRAPRGVSLPWRVVEHVADREQRSAHGDLATIEIEIAPAQTKQLRSSHPRVR